MKDLLGKKHRISHVTVEKSNLLQILPAELVHQIYYEVFVSEDRINPAKTKPPGFLYSCRHVWLEAFPFYYGRNHFVITVDPQSINAVITYLATILCKLNDPKRRAVIPGPDFAEPANRSFGSIHLLMHHSDNAYDSQSFSMLDKLWSRAFNFHKYDSIAKFSCNLELILNGDRKPLNTLVRDKRLIAWRNEQEELRLKLEAEREEAELQRRLCRSAQCLCEFDNVEDRSRTCRRLNPPQGRRVKGLHDSFYVDTSETTESESDASEEDGPESGDSC